MAANDPERSSFRQDDGSARVGRPDSPNRRALRERTLVTPCVRPTRTRGIATRARTVWAAVMPAISGASPPF
jgi:hypothetical protein